MKISIIDRYENGMPKQVQLTAEEGEDVAGLFWGLLRDQVSIRSGSKDLVVLEIRSDSPLPNSWK